MALCLSQSKHNVVSIRPLFFETKFNFYGFWNRLSTSWETPLFSKVEVPQPKNIMSHLSGLNQTLNDRLDKRWYSVSFRPLPWVIISSGWGTVSRPTWETVITLFGQSGTLASQKVWKSYHHHNFGVWILGGQSHILVTSRTFWKIDEIAHTRRTPLL